MNNTKRRFVLAGIISLSLVATACGSDEGASEATDAPTTVAAVETTVAPEAGETTTVAPDTTMASEMVGGEVFVTGSSTVEPISVRVAELADEMSGGALAVTVEGPGTGDGFQKFCAGEADVSDASRPIKDEEAALCAEAGVEYVEIEVAIDGLTVATSPNNTAVECLDVPALYALIGPEAEGFANWSDANALATEVGSAFTAPRWSSPAPARRAAPMTRSSSSPSRSSPKSVGSMTPPAPTTRRAPMTTSSSKASKPATPASAGLAMRSTPPSRTG